MRSVCGPVKMRYDIIPFLKKKQKTENKHNSVI